MEKTVEGDALAETAIHNAGGGFFTAIIDNEHYYDEDLNRQTFEDGKLYFPSILVKVLGIQQDIAGESILYQVEGNPRFIHYKNMSFALSQLRSTGIDAIEDLSDPIRCVAQYNSFLDLPSWMGVETLVIQLHKQKEQKKVELDDIVMEEGCQLKKNIFVETLITTLVLSLQSIFIIPIIMEHSIWVKIGYFVPAFCILTRFIGSSIRRFLRYKTYERQFKERKVDKINKRKK